MSVPLQCVANAPVGYEPVVDSCTVLQRHTRGKERGSQRGSERTSCTGSQGETRSGQSSHGSNKNNGSPGGFRSNGGVRNMCSDQYSSCPSAQNSIGTLLRRARLRRTMTSQELATASGVDVHLIEQIESGKIRFPPNEVVTTLSTSLDAHLHAGIAEPS